MEIRTTTHASRQIRKLPAEVRGSINDAIDTLALWPDVENVKRLTGRNDFRLRVGRYRIIFEVTANVIWVTQIRIRDDRTYQ